jgi:hypoxanthine-DNA glycosylase
MTFLIHPFDPVFDRESELLILGTFPSVESRNTAFYYGHPRNRFWNVLAGVFNDPAPDTVPAKREYLLKHRIALWDVIASCEIDGSADASIRAAKPNDLSVIINNSRVAKILCNGKKSYELYCRFNGGRIAAKPMPSTSPANAAFSLTRLIAEWRGGLLPADAIDVPE